MKHNIKRNPAHHEKQPYDLIITGGGIYGVMLAYEAARRGLYPLMLEQNDFINATSLNHLRTVHGGFRYLQSMDLNRFRESVGERKWYLKHFPQYVTPMPCLLPLYGKGVYRSWILGPGLLANDILSCYRNRGVNKDRRLPRGRLLSSKKTKVVFPGIDGAGLKGGAVWYDANIQEYQRLMMDVISSASSNGANFLNYMKVTALLKSGGTCAGVLAKDMETGGRHEFKAPVVINAAGPWSRDIAAAFDKDHEPLFRRRLLLWNILFDREAPSQYALGLMPGKGKGHTYFFHPWKNRLLVGTGELPVERGETETTVPRESMDRFIEDMNIMLPGAELEHGDIQRVYSGILPATGGGKLAGREVIYNHGSNGGPKGLYSVSGVKFTTSRLVADKVLRRVFPGKLKSSHTEMLAEAKGDALSFDYLWKPSAPGDLEILKNIIETESVVHLSDLILRRTSLGDHPHRALEILPAIRPLFDWDDQRWKKEVTLLETQLKAGMP